MSEPNDMQTLIRTVAPIVVTAPTARNGVTLVQRLLNSSRQVMVYGENLALVDLLPGLLIEMAMLHQRDQTGSEADRQRVRDGDSEFWSSGLRPRSAYLASQAMQSFYQLVAVYERSSREDGFARWGIKNPMARPQTLQWMSQLMPACRSVFIYRNPLDAAASGKARRFLKTPACFAGFGRKWAANFRGAMSGPRQSVHVIRYETLLSDRREQVAALEAFTGLTGIDPAVLDKKINTFSGVEANGHSPTQYIAPSPLTPEETRALLAGLGDVLDAAGYADAAVA